MGKRSAMRSEFLRVLGGNESALHRSWRVFGKVGEFGETEWRKFNSLKEANTFIFSDPDGL